MEIERQCVNFKLCEGSAWLNTDLCVPCERFEWGKLTIFESNQKCTRCHNLATMEVVFPTHCDHSICLSCFKFIMYWDEANYHVSEETFDCPPCPNGCRNPVVGPQCWCLEYDEVKDKWRTDFPNKSKQHSYHENHLIETIPYPTKQCPTCHKEYSGIVKYPYTVVSKVYTNVE